MLFGSRMLPHEEVVVRLLAFWLEANVELEEVSQRWHGPFVVASDLIDVQAERVLLPRARDRNWCVPLGQSVSILVRRGLEQS